MSNLAGRLGCALGLVPPTGCPISQDPFHPPVEFLESPQQIVVTLLKFHQAIQFGVALGGEAVWLGGGHGWKSK